MIVRERQLSITCGVGWVVCAVSEDASVNALLDNDNGQARLVGGSDFGEGIVQLRDLMVGLYPPPQSMVMAMVEQTVRCGRELGTTSWSMPSPTPSR